MEGVAMRGGSEWSLGVGMRVLLLIPVCAVIVVDDDKWYIGYLEIDVYTYQDQQHHLFPYYLGVLYYLK